MFQGVEIHVSNRSVAWVQRSQRRKPLLSLSRRLPGLTSPWAWYHLAGPPPDGLFRVVLHMGQKKKARQKKQVALHVCLLALHALRTATCRRPRRGGEGKGSHTRCYLGSEENQLIEGKNAGIVRCREETQSDGDVACGLVARGVSPSRGGPTLQSGAELHVGPPPPDETR